MSSPWKLCNDFKRWGERTVFEDAHQIPRGACLSADFCIVGGGPVAIALALRLARTGKEILILPGGGWKELEQDRDRYRGQVEPTGSHEPLEENRRRVWGGTGTVWGGRCVPFDSIDYEKRPWIPHSGWPISQAEAEKHLQEALEFCEAGPGSFDANLTFPGAPQEILKGFDNHEWSTRHLERWSPPTHFARRHHESLRNSSKIRILIHGQATHLQLRRDGCKIEHVRAAARPGQEFCIQAKAFVLACGGLENPRLLLAARDVQQNGVGNHRDQVGRYYQSHLFGVCGRAALNKTEAFVYDFERDARGVYCRRRFWLTSKAQRRHKSGNVVGFFFRELEGTALHRDAVTSSVVIAKSLLRASPAGWQGLQRLYREQGEFFSQHFQTVWRQAPAAAPLLLRLVVDRWFGRRRLPFLLPPQHNGSFPLFYQAEHAPNPESRVVLSAEDRDDLGIPRLVVKIRFSPVDFHTVEIFHREFQKRLRESRIGEFYQDPHELAVQFKKMKNGFNSNAHHIGTTRMSTDPGQGVVDKNARVHGVDNLFLAGSSVFSTSGHANPTLLAVALALRLADFLGEK